MTTQLRTYRVWAAFEVPQGTDDDEINSAIRSAFFDHECFNMRELQFEEPQEGDPSTLVRTWAQIDAPANMPWDDISDTLEALYRGFRYPLIEQSMVIHERPDDVDLIIGAYDFRRRNDKDDKKGEVGGDQPALHSLSFWWVSAPAEGEARASAPKEGTFLAKFQSRGPLAIPSVGDTVSLFSHRVKVVGRSFDYEYSDAYEYDEGESGAACTEVGITVFVETPLPRPFATNDARSLG